MKSGLVILAIVAGLLAGCVSVSGPGLSPGVATPTLGITTPVPSTVAPTASTATTSSPTASPTLASTASPSPAPSPTETPLPTTSASVAPTPSSGPIFETRDLLFEDTFDDDTSGWGIGNTPGGDISYLSSALTFDLPVNGNWIWSRRDTGEINGTLRLVGEFTASSDGRFGLLCASGEELYGAILSTSGGYWFVRIGEDGAEELGGDENAGLEVPTGVPTRFVLECAGLATDAFRMQLWQIDTGPVGIYESDEGPQNFDRVGAYVEASSDGFSGRLETVHAFGVTGADGQPDAAGEDLLAHVPDDWQDSCYQSPVPALSADFATTNLVCFIDQPGNDGAEVFEYTQFDSKAEMDRAYQSRVAAFGTGDDEPSCQDGSGEHSYTINEIDAGRLLCIEQVVGIRFDWTDDRLNILSSAVDFDGDFGSTYTDWVDGGPNL